MKASAEHSPVNGIEQLLRANEIALQIHDGQPYGKGPRTIYEGHLLPTTEFAVCVLGYGALTAAMMLLHDGIEDGMQPGTEKPVTGEWLVDQGLYVPVVESVEHMSRLPGETNDAYICRLIESGDKRAIAGKFTDGIGNLSNTFMTAGLEGIRPEKRRKRTCKYAGNLALLTALRPEPEELYEGEGHTIHEVIAALEAEKQERATVSLPPVLVSAASYRQAA